MSVWLLDELGICAVLGRCTLSPGAAVTLCINTVFDTPFTSSKSMCDCSLMKWKGSDICCCSFLKLAFVILSVVLDLSVDGC